MATLKELITKVIPLKGILRTPSYWMRKVLTAIADTVEAVQTESRNADSVLQGNLAIQEDMFSKSIFYAKLGQPFFVLGENTKAVVDGTLMGIEAYKVYKANTLSFDDYRINIPSHLSVRISVGISGIIFANDDFTSLDLSNFDTSAVTNMTSMFSGCSGLTSLDLSNFDTSAVTSMNSMFNGCTSLTSLDLSNFDTSAVTSMYSMFQNCTALTSLDLSNFDTSAVTSMGNMFNGCTALKNIKCKQAFKDWCVANASTINLNVANITWEIVQ